MRKKEVKALVVGDYVIDIETDKTLIVGRLYKSGVLLYDQWKNDFGVFMEDTFVKYSDLLTNRFRMFE